MKTSLSEPIPGPAYRIITLRLVIRYFEHVDVFLFDLNDTQSMEHLLSLDIK